MGKHSTVHLFFRFEKLSEDIPVGGLAEKYMRMINTFSQEMDRIAKFFKKQVRNRQRFPKQIKKDKLFIFF